MKVPVAVRLPESTVIRYDEGNDLLVRFQHDAQNARTGVLEAEACVAMRIALTGEISPWLFANHPMGNPPAPEGYTWDLLLLYFVFAVTIVVLYFPCRWFAELKARRKDWWLSYL